MSPGRARTSGLASGPRSNHALATLAAPCLEETSSPLLMSDREKLVLLDAAIAECALCREKHRTLRDVLKEGPHGT